MSVEFRQRTPGEYAQMLWRRKWMIVLPTVAVAAAVSWVVWRLPNTYESQTLLTVRPASISTSAVPQLSDNDLTLRINNIGQEVVSRTSLEPIIERYNLYAAERRRGEPMDMLVERMRNEDIKVELNRNPARNDIINGFYLYFRGPDPRVTQAVTAELASKYVNAQNKAAGEETTLTRDFFDQKLREEEEKLKAIDARRLQLMQSRIGSLPTEYESLIAQLSGLRDQQKTLTSELGRMNDQRTANSKFVADLEKARGQEIIEISRKVEDPKATLAYAELVKRQAQLKAERENLLTIYKPKHPDVQSVENQIKTIQVQMDEMVEEGKRKIEVIRKEMEERVDPRLNSYRSDIARLDNEIKRQQRSLAQTEGAIADIERRLNQVPSSEVGLEAINREYQSAKAVYEKLLEQQKKAELGADIVANAQGETIAVIDPASLPERHVAPKRPFLMVLGLCAGLCVGLLLAVAFEAPRLLTLQTTADAEHYTGLPVLAALPNLRTPREERLLKLRRAGFAFAGLALTVVSVPALAFLLRVSRVVELLT
jgi:polysaccharide chain length determinant protein (PEP-CTERM system associated)